MQHVFVIHIIIKTYKPLARGKNKKSTHFFMHVQNFYSIYGIAYMPFSTRIYAVHLMYKIKKKKKIGKIFTTMFWQ